MPDLRSNDVQDMAIRHASGPMQVLAGPGSGKTWLTIRRIRHLIQHHGISPGHILVITFTKAAALEMEQRFSHLTQNAYKEVYFGTFHAVYYHILNHSGPFPWHLASSADKINCLKHIFRQNGIEEEPDSMLLSAVLRKISQLKSMEHPEQLFSSPGFWMDIPAGNDKISEKFPVIFQEYSACMKEMHQIDFDDIILFCFQLLQDHPDILAFWQNTFSHILIDEFQDISPLQYKVLRMLAAPADNLFTVGDDDQSIYGFRGAGPDIMKQFMNDYPKATQLLLHNNYRCGEAIVKASELVIGGNKNRFPRTATAKSGINSTVRLLSFQTKEEETQYLTAILKKEFCEKRSDIAVIFRTNAEAASFSRQLAAQHIPFYTKEKTENLFETPTARDMLSYLQFAYDSFSCSGKRADFYRIMNKPLRYLSRSCAASSLVVQTELLNFYQDKPYMQKCITDFYMELKRTSRLCPYLAIDYVRKSIGYDRYLAENRAGEEYKRHMETADEIQKSAAGFRTLKEWTGYIEEYTAALKNSMGKTKKQENSVSGIQLMTMHASKGLEYEKVWLPDIKEGSVPAKKAASPSQIEEERRLFYVAMTRAKTSLEILYYGTPSRFISPLL